MPHGYGPLVLPRLDDGANRRRSPQRGTVREVEAARRCERCSAHSNWPRAALEKPSNRRELTSGSKCDITIREMGLVRKCLERRYERMSPEDKPAAGGEMHRRAQVAAAQITAAHAALAGSAAAQGQSRAEHQGWWTCRSTASPARMSNC